MPDYTINPITLKIEGKRPANMFSISTTSGGNQIWLPNPEKDSGKALTSTLVNSARNLKGVVTAQKICRDQDKIELTWSFLTIEEWEPLLEFWYNNFEFSLNYYNPIFHKRCSRIFYIGDRSWRPFDIDTNGIPTAYIECSANVVDTGMSL